MKESKEQYFKIGEMAELFGLNIRTLRYYDEIGLVRPALVDPDSGYRYYSTAQFEPLNTIRYLRELGVSLEEIRQFLKGRDVESMRQMMQTQLEEVEARQRNLDLIRRKLQNRLAQIEGIQAGLQEKVSIQRLDERKAYLLRYAVRPDTDLEFPIRLLAREVGSKGVFLGMIGLSIDMKKLKRGKFDHYDYIFLLQEAGETPELLGGQESDGPHMATSFPAGEYAILQFRGTHTEAAGHYPGMVRYIQEQGYRICGSSLEITLVDYGLTSDPANFVTELQIPVERAE